ncbi:MAG: 2-amino-4-hydroxy-6-hydroxymethyldihydropteridine diphosphokinase [Planctomycetaceae bacterium]|nr:2-amino-4-hydroxy-6-hydroxymethyldihydropteridine diphosphokinase [Planctomycetaceae bacterium]
MAMVYVGLGTNLGDRLENIREARKGLAVVPDTDLLDNAPIYETSPVGGPGGQENYYNTVSLVDTRLEPVELLRHLHAIERLRGRRREGETSRWGPRLLDLDILLWDDSVVEEPNLTVPHPRMAERAFVLAPLADLDPDFLHPVLDLTIRELLQRIPPDDAAIRRLSV